MGSWKASRALLFLLFVALLAIIPLLIACAGPAGPAGSKGDTGAAGAAGTSSGTIAGAVTNSLTTAGVSGVTVTLAPAITGVSVTTDDSGGYTATVPIGTYTLTFAKTNFTSATETVSVVGGQTATKNVALVPPSKVVVNAGADQTASIGGIVTLTATVTALDGSTVTGYQWTQTEGAAAALTNDTTSSATATLGDTAAYRNELISSLEILDRFVVQAVNPHSLEAAETATFKVTVTTSSGTYTDTVNVSAELPFAVVSLGIRNVPTGLPVLLHGEDQASYSWSITTQPSGSTAAALDDSTIQNPSFTPDVAGKYTLTEATSGATIDVYAGTWAGAITGQDANGLPLAASCTTCHNGTIAPDMFTAWAASGHAEIFTQNINNPSGHWSAACASCHTVGYNTTVTNGGFDEAMAQDGWTVPSHGEVGLWTSMLANFPNTARMANIQCENCHGPNTSSAHMTGSARISLASDVCGVCHGEPPRHGRFQQWEESNHADFTLAVSRGMSTSCSRCHSAQGFLTWLPKLEAGNSGSLLSSEITWTADTVEPQTCVVCHDPHEQGTTSGEPNTATVRVEGDTAMLPAGFQAFGVGKGALCMTCHNTRNGARNDSVYGSGVNLPSYSAPHTAAQADVLMGENAFFVEVGQRSPHSFIEDTCATCHMELTAPPEELSYNLGGTNHTFEASMDICTSCHGVFNGGTLQESVEAKLHELGEVMADYLLAAMPAQIQIKDYTPHEYQGTSYDLKSANATIDTTNIAAIEPVEPHGQQGFLIEFVSPVSFTYTPTGGSPHTVSLSEAEVQLGDITTDGTTKLIALSDPLVKAGWNYFLIEGDGSEGVHNPSFSIAILNAAIAALQ